MACMIRAVARPMSSRSGFAKDSRIIGAPYRTKGFPEVRRLWPRYCQLKPDVAVWTCGAHSVISDNSMDSLQANGALKGEFWLG